MATIIANPIYDSVFKFLMSDHRAACVILSDILQREVVEVTMRNNDYVKKLNSDITVLRIDFGAKVRESDGTVENVNIELQKAWLTTEVMRFRKYLAQQYQSDDNRFIIQDRPLRDKPLHMVNIYLLGHNVDGLDHPVTYVYPRMFDQHGESIACAVRDVDFVNELVHDMIIVQIPKITKMSVKTRLDKLLTLFDQAQTHGSAHELSVDESSYNGDHRYVLNRLVYAKSDESVCKDMDLEDEFQTVLERWEQTETELKSRIADKDKQLASQEKELETKDKQLANKDEQLASQQSQLASKDKQLADQQEQLAASIRLLKSLNLSNEEIASKLGISQTEVKRY